MTCCGGKTPLDLSEDGPEAQPASIKTGSRMPSGVLRAVLHHMPHSVGHYGRASQHEVCFAVTDRQPHNKGCSLAHAALSPDLAAMGLHDVTGDGQPQSRTLLPLLPMIGTLVKLIKDPGHVLCRNPLPGITHPDFDPALALFLQASHHPDSTTFRREFHGVAQQIVEHLLHSPFVEAEVRQGRGAQHLDVQPLLLRYELHRLHTPLQQHSRIAWRAYIL